MQVSLTMEFMFVIVTNLVSLGVCIGIYSATIQFMKQQLSDMKEDSRRQFEELREENKQQLETLKHDTKEQLETLKVDTKEQLEEHSKINDIKVDNLREEVKKHNNVLTRLALAENSIKSAHARIDELVDER